MDPDSLGKLDKSELITLILALNARVAALEAKLNIPPKTPDNSSAPPSTGQKANRPETPKPPRKGRPGVTRALNPKPDHVREVYAKACNGCGARLSKADQPGVHAYDHIDLPPIRPVTTRINLHRCACPRCGTRVTATPPADMPVGSPFGHCCRGLPRRHQAKVSWRWWSICMRANWSATTGWSRCCTGCSA